MRPVHHTLLASLLTVTSACSYTTTFVVLNESASPIEIVYILTTAGSPCPDDQFYMRPRVQTKASIDRLEYDKATSNPIGEYTCKADGTVTLQLPPGFAVAIFQISGWGGHLTEQRAQQYPNLNYGVATLQIRGASGQMQFSGTQVTRDFKKSNDGLYVLAYQ